ncbi:RNA methyltransferase [Umezawaea sp. Da 62-37]|uniref:TrmH family RNA methyltransferase n=1 Tax=Umezawaea sp. Da 62-37 TaxID=3075927 RepID=UPI0028F72257|nr:RNA methyltransferase [Umezawaea sp. Da 62-37]WNV91269.1 RNA methyltransferase [Umezawaea sp. Da 62-37]
MQSVVLEGFHAVKHALRFGAVVEPLVAVSATALAELAESHAPDLVDVLAGSVREVSTEEFVRLVGKRHPTGVAGFTRKPDVDVAGLLAGRVAPLVLLDNPRNLGNFGAVVRVAAGLGAGGVVSVGDVDPWHPNVLRGSAGLHFALPVGRADGLDGIAGPVYALDADGADIGDVRIPSDAVLAFGSERHGLSEAMRERADHLVSLPMRPLVSSYNLTTSVAMALYHWELSQRAS